jgi:hypothetical protein
MVLPLLGPHPHDQLTSYQNQKHLIFWAYFVYHKVMLGPIISSLWQSIKTDWTYKIIRLRGLIKKCPNWVCLCSTLHHTAKGIFCVFGHVPASFICCLLYPPSLKCNQAWELLVCWTDDVINHLFLYPTRSCRYSPVSWYRTLEFLFSWKVSLQGCIKYNTPLPPKYLHQPYWLAPCYLDHTIAHTLPYMNSELEELAFILDSLPLKMGLIGSTEIR